MRHKLLGVLLVCLTPCVAPGFFSNGRWQFTALDGVTAPTGEPVTITWSIVPDGTTLLGPSVTSDLIADFDAFYNENGSGPLTDRDWFAPLEQSFTRWNEISGVNYVYEPNDDGALFGLFAGVAGVRGDVRVAGRNIDGNGGTFAQIGFIDNADMTIDTGDTIRYGNQSANSFNLRHTVAHEAGHGIGLGHVSSSVQALMEPFAQTGFEGPQFDDIRGAHFLYGDALEKAAPGGNDLPANATPLGPLGPGESLVVGADTPVSGGTLITLEQTDFVSIANSSDFDYFKFAVDVPTLLDATLRPRGPIYSETPEGGFTRTVNSVIQSDLTLLVLDSDGVTLLDFSANAGLGAAESLSGVELAEPGEYFVRVSGSTSDVQFYDLTLSAETFAPLPGDFNQDNLVDAADYTLWRDNLGTDFPLPNAPESPGVVDIADYQTWVSEFGKESPSSSPAPEPQSLFLIAALMLGGAWRLRVSR